MTKKSQHRFFRDERGAVAATYALALVPLIAVAGLAFDYARVAGMETELQNAADQAALAGATQLTRTSGSMERAIAAIQGGLVANNTAFSNDGAGNTVAITNAASNDDGTVDVDWSFSIDPPFTANADVLNATATDGSTTDPWTNVGSGASASWTTFARMPWPRPRFALRCTRTRWSTSCSTRLK